MNIAERTTAVTSLIQGSVLFGSSLYLYSLWAYQPYKVSVWCGCYVLVGLASFLASIGHGFEMSPKTYANVWRVIFFFLGLGVGLFCIAFINDLWGQSTARMALPWVIAASVVFIVVASVPADVPFLPLAIHSVLVLLFGLACYGYLCIRGSSPGAGLILTGLVISILGAVVQVTRALSFTVRWPFDHNSVYHFFNSAAYFIMMLGVRSSLLGGG